MSGSFERKLLRKMVFIRVSGGMVRVAGLLEPAAAHLYRGEDAKGVRVTCRLVEACIVTFAPLVVCMDS